MQVTSVPFYMRLLGWLKGMPEWFKASVLGGALVLATIFALAWANSASADDVTAIAHDLHDLKARITACESEDDDIQKQLDRIEDKVDQLILKLIPGD